MYDSILEAERSLQSRLGRVRLINLFGLLALFSFFHVVTLLRKQASAVDEAEFPTCAIMYSAVIPSHSESPDILRKTLDSITDQPDIPSFEIIVVRDGYSKIEEFIDFARSYRANPGKGVLNIDTRYLLASRYSLLESTPSCGGVVRFVTKTNFGPATTRNVGFSLASGKWVHPIDGDDQLKPGFFTSIKILLKAVGLSLQHAGEYSVIMPALAKANGHPASWQPGGDLASITEQNRLHCCGLLLRSMFGDVRMNPFMSMGWEDWDFWINAHFMKKLKVFYALDAFYIYSSWTEVQFNKVTVSSFCAKTPKVCTAMLHFANNHIYDWESVRAAVSLLLGLKNKNLNLFLIPKPFRDQIKDLAKANHPESMLFRGMEFELVGENTSAVEMYDAVYTDHCGNENDLELVQLSKYLRMRLKTTPTICPYENLFLTSSLSQTSASLAEKSTTFAKDAIFGECAIVYTVIIYSGKYDSERSLRIKIDLIIRQTVLPNFEIIVARDTEYNDEVFVNVGRHYKMYPGRRLGRVECISLIDEKQDMKRPICPEQGSLKLFQTGDIGLANSLNFAISMGSGLWVHVLNPAGVFCHRMMESILGAFSEKQLLLSNTGFYNVISVEPPVGLLSIKLLELLDDYTFGNYQMLFLRAMFDEGVRFNPLMSFGWTNRDFWTSMHSTYQLQIFEVLLLPDVGAYIPTGVVASQYCSVHLMLCRGVFRMIHHDRYTWTTVTKAIEEVRNYNVTNLNLLSLENLNPETILVQGLILEKMGKIEQGNHLYEKVYLAHCKQNRALAITRLASYLANRNFECIKHPETTVEPMNFQELQFLVEQSKTKNLFHMILTSKPTNLVWVKLMHHAIVGVLKFNPNAILIIHTPLHNAIDLFHAGFFENFQGKLFLADIADEELATGTDMEHILYYMKKNAAGRPFYYSHFTDFYRFLIIYILGGTYLDMDIVLRGDISHLSNTLCPQSEGYLNGAFMVFEKGHAFIKACLNAIPSVYDPFNWSTIGPHLITSMTNSQELTGAYTPLHRASFYAISWENAVDLITSDVDRSAYDELQFSYQPHYGYHFWSRILFRGEHEFKRNSLGGWALIDTCLPKIMACILGPESSKEPKPRFRSGTEFEKKNTISV